MSNIEDIADRTAAGIALAYRSGEAGPRRADRMRARPDRQGPRATTSSSRSAPTARGRRPGRREGRYEVGAPLSPLDGVPIAWKDLFDVAGTPTTAGSKLFAGGPAKTADLACVANAAAAGMVSRRQAQPDRARLFRPRPQSALSARRSIRTTARRCARRAARPRAAAQRSPARLVPCAIGSDTGGSVRIPAAFNGVVGYKTSTGRIDATGLVPLARSYDTIGPLARSVEDCILLDMVLRGAVTTPVRRARALVACRARAAQRRARRRATTAVVENFERSLEALARAGVSVRRERVETLDDDRRDERQIRHADRGRGL